VRHVVTGNESGAQTGMTGHMYSVPANLDTQGNNEEEDSNRDTILTNPFKYF